MVTDNANIMSVNHPVVSVLIGRVSIGTGP